MALQYHITSSCTIRNQHIRKDGLLVIPDSPNLCQSDSFSSDGPALLVKAYRQLQMNYPKFYKMDNLSKLAIIAAEFILKDNTIKERHDASRIGVILSNKNASLDSDIRYFDSVGSIPSPALFVYTLPNIMTGEICIKHKFKGENAFFVSDKTNEDFIHQYVTGLLNNNIIDACLCGWVEVMGENLEAMILIVEKSERKNINEEKIFPFTINNIKNIYALQDGKVDI